MTDVYVGSGGTAPSDGELILEVRGGSLDAYGALYERHSGAARVLARQYVRCDGDADDVVSDAFQRVLGMLQQGNGPDTHFRAYLFTVVRRLAADVAHGARRTRPTADDGTFEHALGPSASPEDPALAGFENSVVARAYESLPERWQAVLWYTEVEGLSPAEVAPILGLTPNGVSALAYRAREGLRVGYLQQHLSSEPADSCRVVNPLLGGYVRGSLARREVTKVDRHLEVCAECRTLVLELGDVAHGMRAVVAPLVVGLAGTAILGALPLGAATFGAGAGAGAGAGVAGAGASGAAGTGAAAGTGTGAAGAAGAGTGAAGAGTGTAVGTSAATGAAGAGATGAGAAGAGAGAAGAGAAGASAGAGAGAAGAGAGAAGAGAATAASTTAAGATTVTLTSAGTATAATGTAATAAGATAAGATAAGVSGATVAASTGAVAAATVGVVSVLGAIGDADVSQEIPDGPLLAVESTPWPTTDGDEAAASPAPSPEPSEDPTDPANLLVDPSAQDELGVVDPAVVSVLVPQAAEELQPRATEYLTFQVTNPGGRPAVDAHVRLTLPAGMQHARAATVRGAAPVPRPLTLETLPCTATAQPQEVLCRLGTIEADELATVRVPVFVRDGGSYDVVAEVWAEGLEARRLALPPTRVDMFGPELTTRAADVEVAANPGLAAVPFSVRNTGDQVTAEDWAVRVRVPAGLVPHSVSGGLGCEVADVGAWLCTGGALQPGEVVEATATVVADGRTAAGAYAVAVEPTATDGPTISSASSVEVPRGWAGVLAGVGGIRAECRATGGVGEADAVVIGSYTNTTGRTVTAVLRAAGSTASKNPELAPGERATLTVPDGLRVPAGSGSWTVSTTVAGVTYSRTVGSGTHGAAECYDPRWDVETSARVVNDGGRVTVQGTIVNHGDEPMQAGMSALGSEADRIRLDAGERSTFSVATGSTSTDAGEVSFDLYRWVTDADGDQPAAGVVPATTPTATFPAATISPAAGKVVPAGACRYDPVAETSTRTFTVPLDNRDSTLPVVFTIDLGDHVEEVRLAGGESARVDVDVPWGTGEAEVLADGRPLATVDLEFAGCSTAPDWPDAEVEAAPQCEGGDARLVVDVVADGGRTWRATLLRDGDAVTTRKLPADGAVRFVDAAGGARLDAGAVTVRLTRTIEGTAYSVQRTVEHEGTSCIVVAPGASLDESAVQMDRYGDYAKSWREVGVVLDNTASTVDVVFHVHGPRGLDTDVAVPAGTTRTVEPRRIDGRQGGRWTVSAGSWSTALEADTFTAAEAGWCSPRIAWGEHYEAGDVRSWNGFDYRYEGWDDEGLPAADRSRAAEKKGRGQGGADESWYDAAEWEGVWMGQWRQWERVGLCEYR
ncbi:sigma-70 family RNA polymerase sigma factor [Isoptericola sp. AK164]|uniref:sigma-70 family RNA polymerase sigma factor n=1 Tax=Isoptericola sp. AK164 TaxID=3024246 RepID=UPI0024188E87|nr:sigma-70 family RNA polymerase sigma factor [Isoptericola sp. AK164]